MHQILQEVGKNGYRFMNAVSDMSYHAKPLRQTKNYKENVLKDNRGKSNIG